MTMRSLFVMFSIVALSCTVYAQDSGYSEKDLEREMLFYEHADGESRPEMSHRDRSASTWVGGTVSGFAYGAMTTFNQAFSSGPQLQMRTGLLATSLGTQSSLETAAVLGNVIPVFVGVRFNLAYVESRSFDLTPFVMLGAGPMVGVLYPTSSSMWQSFSRMSFRWGGGAYAGVGAEMRFSSGWGGFANLEYDAFGFTSPMLMYQSYLGPSYSFGIQRYF